MEEAYRSTFSGCWALGLALALSCTGCIGQPSEGTASPETDGIYVDLVALRNSLMLEEAEKLIECMANEGFTLTSLPNRPIPEVMQWYPGTMPLEPATRFGYDALDGDGASRRYVATLWADFAGLGADAEAALGDQGSFDISIDIVGVEYSAGTGGCIGEARDAAYGSVEVFLWLAYAPDQALASGDYAMLEEQLALPVESWSACMDARGFDFGTPRTAWEQGMSDQEDGQLSATEYDLATADSKCRMGSGIDALVEEFAGATVERWFAEHPEELSRALGILRALGGSR